MKKYRITFILSAITLFAWMFHATGCAETTAKENASLNKETFPKLLERNPFIGSDEEREKVLANYVMLKNSLWSNPQNIEDRLKLTQLFMLEARATGEHGHYYPAALAVLETVTEKNPPQDQQFWALSLKASVLLSLHQFDNAKEVAKQAIAINPYNAQIYGVLVDAFVEMGEYENAVKMADKMVSIRPDLRSYSRVSYLREIHGEIEGAIDAMNQAATAGYPGFEETAWCRLTLGELYETYGKLDQAEAEYKRVLVERENYPFAIAALAGIEQEKGNLEEAENLYKEACRIIPEVSFYEELAALYQEMGRTEEAEKLIGEVLEMLADDEANGHKMGLAYASVYLNLKGDTDKALAYTLEEYKMRPNNNDVNKMLAQVYAQNGDWEKCEKHLVVAKQTNSSDPDLIDLSKMLVAK